MFFTLPSLAALATLTLAAPAPADPAALPVTLATRADTSNITEIDHDAVVGFAETAPDTTDGTLYLKYKPYLYRYNGCVPFPAVDVAGQVSGGLKPTGSQSGHCTSSPGQIYARGTTYDSKYAIMYAWYMPKDEPSTGLGHRHDWECAIVWLDSDSESDATIIGLSASAHGGFQTKTADFAANFNGDAAFVEYISYWPLDHQMIISEEQGLMYPLIAWESMGYAARYTLSNWDFGDANVPFKDDNFENNLAKAWAAA